MQRSTTTVLALGQVLYSLLLKCHLEVWVQGCQKKGLQLKGKEGEEALARFTGVPLQHQAQAQDPFSQEVFCDALVKFTVATDQVSFFFLFFNSPDVLILSSPLELWRERSFRTSFFCFVLNSKIRTSLIIQLCTSTLLRLMRHCRLYLRIYKYIYIFSYMTIG